VGGADALLDDALLDDALLDEALLDEALLAALLGEAVVVADAAGGASADCTICRILS
jgi:hypothetical protein